MTMKITIIKGDNSMLELEDDDFRFEGYSPRDGGRASFSLSAGTKVAKFLGNGYGDVEFHAHVDDELLENCGIVSTGGPGTRYGMMYLAKSPRPR